jgi:hypothetical protein
MRIMSYEWRKVKSQTQKLITQNSKIFDFDFYNLQLITHNS